MAKLSMAHASTHGARKPPGPKNVGRKKRHIESGIPRLKKDRTMVITIAKLRKHAWRTQAAWVKIESKLMIIIKKQKKERKRSESW